MINKYLVIGIQKYSLSGQEWLSLGKKTGKPVNFQSACIIFVELTLFKN